MLGHVLRLPPHHLAVRRVLGSAGNWVVVVEDAGPGLLGDRKCLLVRLLHLIHRKKAPDEQVLQAGKLAKVPFHGSGGVTRQLQQGVVVRHKERGGGDGEGKQPAGRIGTRQGEPAAVAVPLARCAFAEGVDGEGLLTGRPRMEEEQLSLGCLLVLPLLSESGGLGLRGSEAEGGGRLPIHRVVVVDPGVVAGQAGGQGLQQAGVVRSAGPHVEGSDIGVAAHRLRNEVREGIGVPVAEDGLGDAHPANGRARRPNRGRVGWHRGVVERLPLRKGATTCTGGTCDGRHPIPSKGTSRHWENQAAFEGQEGS